MTPEDFNVTLYVDSNFNEHEFKEFLEKKLNSPARGRVIFGEVIELEFGRNECFDGKPLDEGRSHVFFRYLLWADHVFEEFYRLNEVEWESYLTSLKDLINTLRAIPSKVVPVCEFPDMLVSD